MLEFFIGGVVAGTLRVQSVVNSAFVKKKNSVPPLCSRAFTINVESEGRGPSIEADASGRGSPQWSRQVQPLSSGVS